MVDEWHRPGDGSYLQTDLTMFYYNNAIYPMTTIQITPAGSSTFTFALSMDKVTYFDVDVMNLQSIPTVYENGVTIAATSHYAISLAGIVALRITKSVGIFGWSVRGVSAGDSLLGFNTLIGGISGTGTDDHIVTWDGTGVAALKSAGPIIITNVISDVSSITLTQDTDNNTWYGYLAGHVSGATGNTAIGENAIAAVSSGGLNNTAVGFNALTAITTGDSNISIGHNAGSNLTVGDSNNIMMGNAAVASDNNRTKIGTRATHDVIDLPPFRARPAPTIDTDLADGTRTLLTMADLRSEIIHVNPDAARNWTLPNATAVVAGLVGQQDNDCIDFYIINADTGGTNDIRLVSNTGHTIVGNTDIPSASTTAHTEASSAHFRLRILPGPACITYRLA